MKTEKKVREVGLPPIPIREITITNKSGHSLNVHALEPYGKLGTLQIAIEDGEERLRLVHILAVVYGRRDQRQVLSSMDL